MKGIYCLIIYLSSDKNIKIGALGLTGFNKGYYIYVGSALNSLEKRIARHRLSYRSNKKKMHWHIDYLLEKARIVDVTMIETSKKLECVLSRKIANLADSSVKGFGCSDCRCKSHLYYFKKKPELLYS